MDKFNEFLNVYIKTFGSLKNAFKMMINDIDTMENEGESVTLGSLTETMGVQISYFDE